MLDYIIKDKYVLFLFENLLFSKMFNMSFPESVFLDSIE